MNDASERAPTHYPLPFGFSRRTMGSFGARDVRVDGTFGVHASMSMMRPGRRRRPGLGLGRRLGETGGTGAAGGRLECVAPKDDDDGRTTTRMVTTRATTTGKEKLERVDALLSRLGYCTRGDARGFLKRRVVTRRLPGADADETEPTRVTTTSEKAKASEIAVDGEGLDHPNGLLVVMHKPGGLVCSHDEREGANVYELLPERWRGRKPSVESVGRLDKDTTGLLLFTDDGRLNHALTSPKKDVGKWYRVKTDREIPAEAVEVFASGTLTLEGESKACRPAVCEILSPLEARLELKEGKFHQVKRMFAFFGCTVVELHRESFGSLTLESVAPNAGDIATLPMDFEF